MPGQTQSGGVNIDGSGIMSPGYVPMDGPALQQMQKIALSKGLSPWATMADEQQRQVKETALEQGAGQVAGTTAGADANLAASGGLSSGARERTAETGQKNYLSMSQDLDRQEGLNKAQISMNDQQNKIQQLGTVGQVEGSNATAANAFNANLYDQQMNAWAANQQAAATRDSAKK